MALTAKVLGVCNPLIAIARSARASWSRSSLLVCVMLRVWLRRVWMVVCVIKQLWGCALFFLSFIIESSLDDLRTCANDSDGRNH